MIRIETTTALSPREQYGLDVLVDLSRVARAGDAMSSVATVLRVGASTDAGTGSGAASSPLPRLGETVVVGDGVATIGRAALGAVADIAGAAVEQRASGRDRHGRVPSSENPLVRAGSERVPVVSHHAAGLRRALARAAGRRPLWCVTPWPGGRRWSAAFTHDVDIVGAWPAFAALRIAELLGKGEMRRAASALAAAATAAARRPVWSAIADLLDVERRAGIVSTWFFLCGTPTFGTVRRGDLVYRPEAGATRRIVDAVRAAGHEIGLHGSFATAAVAGIFAEQRSRLERLSGGAIAGVRQHFLKIRPGATQQWMADAGFTYDATYGFPDRNGFRLGVADVVPAWDEALGRPMGLDEVPLVWMDRAQSKYQRVEDPMRWVADAAALAAASRSVEGLWVGLWHPNLVPALGYPGAPHAFAHLVRTIMDEDPFVAPLERLVAWRQLRRAVRLEAGRDGRPALVSPVERAFDIEVEDAQGVRIASFPATGPARVEGRAADVPHAGRPL